MNRDGQKESHDSWIQTLSQFSRMRNGRPTARAAKLEAKRLKAEGK
jgi:hypothetical protein